MGWVNIAKGARLTAADMVALYGNFLVLRDLLIEAGKTVPPMNDCSATTSTPITAVWGLFSDVESNIQTLHAASGFTAAQDPYYVAYTWPHDNLDLRRQVWRWIDWINWARDAYTALLGEPLYDKNGEPIMDINGAQIYVRGEINGNI